MRGAISAMLRGQHDRNQGDAERQEKPGIVGAQCQHDEDKAGKQPEGRDAGQTGHRQRGSWSVVILAAARHRISRIQHNKRGEPSFGLSGADGQHGDAGLTQDQQGRPVRADAVCQQNGASQQGDHRNADAERLDTGWPGCLVGEAQDQDDEYHGKIRHGRRDRGEPDEQAEPAETPAVWRTAAGIPNSARPAARNARTAPAPPPGQRREQCQRHGGQHRQPCGRQIGRADRQHGEAGLRQGDASAEPRSGRGGSASPRIAARRPGRATARKPLPGNRAGRSASRRPSPGPVPGRSIPAMARRDRTERRGACSRRPDDPLRVMRRVTSTSFVS